MNLDLTLLSIILTPILSLFALFWMVNTTRKLNHKLGEYEPLIQDFAGLLRYEEDEQGKPMLDARLVKIAEAFSSGVAKSLQMSFLGQLSGQKRLEKGLKGAMAVDMVNKQMPILALIGDFMGVNTAKYVEKHPDALMQLAARFAPALMQGQRQNANSAIAKTRIGIE